MEKPGNGSPTIRGWGGLKRLPAMTLEKLEDTFGINLRDPGSPDFGRFDAANNQWYRQNAAGATLESAARRAWPAAGMDITSTPSAETPGEGRSQDSP